MRPLLWSELFCFPPELVFGLGIEGTAYYNASVMCFPTRAILWDVHILYKQSVMVKPYLGNVELSKVKQNSLW